MATTASTSSSLKEYLKKYENNTEDEKKKKKKKKKTKAVASGVLVVDEDPVWQKPVNLEEEEDNDSPDEKPQVDEDIEVKRMRRLELARLTHNRISEDGSGWVPVSDIPKRSTSLDPSSDISPPRKRKARNDTPSPDTSPVPHGGGADSDLSPPRQRGGDLSPPRRQGRNQVSPSPRKRKARNDTPSPDTSPVPHGGSEDSDLSPPRQCGGDLFPLRRRGRSQVSPSPVTTRRSISDAKDTDLHDLSPPRRARRSEDLSPPRKSQNSVAKLNARDGSAQKVSTEADLSPPRKSRVKKSGLITGKDVAEEIAKDKKEEWSRFSAMDASMSGRGAEAVYRYKGERVSKDDFLKLTRKVDKPKEEKKLEWSKGLAQKREAETRLQELELEKAKPFARTRDDVELDSMMKDRIRWGDPMAHLVKKKQPELVLRDLGDSERMKESGFIVPQEIPSHSWLKRGVDYEPNRYGIKPGRHWDGVNRSNGYEKQMFKRMSEKKATEREAYLWSVSDM